MMDNFVRMFVLGLALSVLAVAPCALADEPAGNPLLDDLTAPSAKKNVTKPTASLKQRLQQELTGGEDIGEEAQSPLLRIRRRMKLVEELLASQATSQETQELQTLITDELAALIEQGNKQGESGSGSRRKSATGKQSQSANPMGEGTGEAKAGLPRDSSQRLEKSQGTAPTTADPRELMSRLWGHLPEKVREQMLNAPIEQFLPQYEKLIQAYYKRLSEERPDN